MNHAQRSKLVIVTSPQAIINNASATTASVDTLGFDYVKFTLILGATDIALTALKVQEADADSGYADVTGLVYGTSTNTAGTTSTLPSATDDNKGFSFLVDMRGRKRWLDLVLTVGSGSTGAYVTVIAELYRGESIPSTAALRGMAQELLV